MPRTEYDADLGHALAAARAALATARVGIDQRSAVLAVLEEIDRATLSLGASTEGGPVAPSALEREREGRVAAEASQVRTEFVHQATTTLFSSPLDPVVRLQTLTAVLVPDLADWCFCDLLVEGGAQRLAVRTWNPDREELARSLEGTQALSSPAMAITQRVAGGGYPEVCIDRTTTDGGLLDALGARSYLVVPLTAAGRVIGALTVIFAESNRRYNDVDRRLVEDLAARAALALENARLVAQLERAVRSRDDMMAIVSHDLRNPLSSIQMSAVLLQRSLGDEELRTKRSKTNIILRAVERMESLIRDLLDIASLEGGGVVVEPEDVSVRAILADAAELIQPLATDKGITFEVVGPADDLHVLADRARILQVFSNLLGNAVKFTGTGGRVTLTAAAAGPLCSFTVADTGSGIPTEQLPHVFDRFWRGRQQKSTTGAGLGLAIAKGIVEAHGAVLSVTSAAGQGTTFTFALNAPA